MKKILWISSVALVAAIVAFGSATARKYRSSRHHDRNRGAFLGVSTESVTPRLADRWDLAVEYGAYIDRVYDDTPADEAGLRDDDIIVEFNGTKVRDSDDLSELLYDLQAGDEAKIIVQRDSDTVELTAKLGDSDDFLEDLDWPSNIGAWVTPRVPKAPRAPRAPNAPQAFWFNPHRAFIGISMMDLTRQLGDYFGVEKSRGVLITEIERDSPAEEAGLKAGDVIVRLDGDKVFDSEDIQDIVSELEAGDKVKVVVIRDKKETELEVTVDERDGHYRYNNSWGSIEIPDIPDIDVVIPDGNGLWYGGDNEYRSALQYFRNSREFKDEMRELKEELRELKGELREELHGMSVH
jgi:serine protease Do